MGTFEEHVRWCGIEYHWPLLINSNKRDIAIVDSVQAEGQKINCNKNKLKIV